MMQHFYLSLFLFRSLSTAIPVDVRHTTETRNGAVIDWIPLHSQAPNGSIAAAPPLPVHISSSTNTSTPQPYSALQEKGVKKGPEGTVPVFRGPPLQKNPPPGLQTGDFNTLAVGDHWYASSQQAVNNHGGSATYSLYKAWTESANDFSLLQTAIIHANTPKPGDNSQLVGQTIEAGW
jgi:hypothetical protein